MAPANRHQHRATQQRLPSLLHRWPRVTTWLAWCGGAELVTLVWGRR